MRRLLRRKAVTIIAAIVALTAIPAGGIVATASPALASVTLCNSFGHQYCAGDPGAVNNGDPVVLTQTGRSINLVDQHFTCCGGLEVFQLQLVANTSQCVGVTSDGQFVTLRDCSGGNNNYTNWAHKPAGNGQWYWYSNPLNRYLSSDNVLGDQLFTGTMSCIGCEFRWTN
jgi:hypothetical protein